MRAFLLSLDEANWKSIETGWKHPNKNVQIKRCPRTILVCAALIVKA